jgi:uncharacterized protein YhaN
MEQNDFRDAILVFYAKRLIRFTARPLRNSAKTERIGEGDGEPDANGEVDSGQCEEEFAEKSASASVESLESDVTITEIRTQVESESDDIDGKSNKWTRNMSLSALRRETYGSNSIVDSD